MSQSQYPIELPPSAANVDPTSPVNGPSTAAGSSIADFDGQSAPPPPDYLPKLGIVSLLAGIGIAGINSVVVLIGIQQLNSFGAGPVSTRMLWTNLAIGLVVAALLLLIGTGLMLKQRWGRSLCFAYFVIATLALAYMGVNTKLSGYVATMEAEGGYGEMFFVGAAAPFAIPFSILLCGFMVTPQAKSWAKRQPMPVPYSGPTRVSASAIASLIMVLMTPCLIITPVFSLLTGCLSLRWIGKSGGRLTGAALAWIGVGASLMFFLFIGGAALSILVACSMTDPENILEGFKSVEGVQPTY